MKNIAQIRNIPLFGGLNGNAIKPLASIAQEKKFDKGDIIFHSGDEGSSLFLLTSGAVKISMVDDKGKEIILKVLYEGDFFGEMSLLDGEFRSATVIAIENSHALIIYGKDFHLLIKQHPDLAMEIMVNLSRRLRKLDEKVANLTLSDSYGKVASLLLDMAREKGEKVNGYLVIDNNITRQDMANMLGITRETFTRTLRAFQERGAIDINGRKITIKEETVLQREAF